MLTVALTGGIATGKSYVLTRFEHRGVATIDADSLVHRALMPGTGAARAIEARFGTGVMNPDGGVNRRVLGALVFASPPARRDLEAILHPLVYQSIRDWVSTLARAGEVRITMADVPLLYETGHERDFDAVVVTACTPAVQIARVIRRDGVTDIEASQRLEAQWPIEEKVRRADWVIRTDGTFEDTDRQVAAVYEALVDRAG